MNPASSAMEINGVVRTVPERDCLGLPTFSCHPANEIFVPETDMELRITSFNAIDVEEVSFERLPQSPKIPIFYEVNDPVPIPVWVDGNLRLVLSDTGWEVVANDFDTDKPVIHRLVRALRTAQKFKIAEPPNRIEGLEKFLAERPLPSRHWLSSYSKFLSESDKLRAPDRDYAQSLLADLATRWASECANKADTKLVRSFVDTLMALTKSNSRFAEAETFALLRHVVARPSASRSVVKEMENLRRDLGSPGILDYLQSSPLSQDPEYKNSLYHLTESLRTALLHGRTSQIVNFSRLIGTSRALPHATLEIAQLLAISKVKELSDLANLVLSSGSSHERYMKQYYAVQSLEVVRLLQAVYRLIYPEHREDDLFRTKLMGIDGDTFAELRSVAENKF